MAIREEAMSTGARVGGAKLAAFSVTALAIQALATLLIVFLPEFYANTIGLPVGAVGTAFMAVRAIDLVIDFVLGGLIDATHTPWGRFRPWLLASAPVLVVPILMLFGAERGATTLYLWVWLLVVFLGFSMIVLSHLAWTATLSSDPAGRTRVFAWWQVFATAGQFSILALLPIVARLYPDDPGAGVRAAGWVMAVLIPLAILLAISTVPERVLPARTHARTSPRDYIAIFRQNAVLRLVLADLAIAMSTGIANAVALFFYMGQLGFDRAVASTLILISYAFAFIGTPLFAALAGRVGKPRALMIGALAQAAFQIMVALQPANTFALTAATVAALGLCIPIAWFLPRAMMADVADATRASTGVDRSGLLYASLNGSMKLALGLAVGLAFLLLEWTGFNPANAADPAYSLLLRLLVGGIPALLSLAVALCMYRYPDTRTAG
ncbi:MFS transporter [Sphingomonas profundi]|uniref:MFS transporter n=1 Tax=Alterirhizorhabdus profundi TaxID=2681549 RepID=UPI0012E73180|nr:MFS transporter [Sphingomonas profundi]